jgi:hypothetical protein
MTPLQTTMPLLPRQTDAPLGGTVLLEEATLTYLKPTPDLGQTFPLPEGARPHLAAPFPLAEPSGEHPESAPPIPGAPWSPEPSPRAMPSLAAVSTFVETPPPGPATTPAPEAALPKAEAAAAPAKAAWSWAEPAPEPSPNPSATKPSPRPAGIDVQKAVYSAFRKDKSRR